MKKRIEYVDIAKGIGLNFVICAYSDAFDLMWMMIDTKCLERIFIGNCFFVIGKHLLTIFCIDSSMVLVKDIYLLFSGAEIGYMVGFF